MERKSIVFICVLLFMGINFSVKAQTSVEKLAQKITENDSTDLQKANSISKWITENIELDVKAVEKIEFRKLSAEKIKKKRKALPGEYAELNRTMLTAVGVKSISISGYSLIGPFYMDMSTWNMVKIDSTWYHSDLSAASGAVSIKKQPFREMLKNTLGIPYMNNKMEYIKDLKPEYLLSTSALFKKNNHLPANPTFQINKREISVNDFIKDTIHSRKSNATNRHDIDKYVNYSENFQHYISGDLAYKYNNKNNRIKAESEYAFFRDNVSVPKVFVKTVYSKKQLGEFKKQLNSSNKYYKLHIGDLKKMYSKKNRENANYNNGINKEVKKLETTVTNQYKNYDRVLKSVTVQAVNNSKTNDKLISGYKKILKTADPKFKPSVDTLFRDSVELVVKQLNTEVEVLNNRLIDLSDSTFEHIYRQRKFLMQQKQVVSGISSLLYNEEQLNTVVNRILEIKEQLILGESLFNAQIKEMNTISKAKIKLFSKLKKAKLEYDKYNKGTYITQMDIKINMNHENIQQNTNYNNWARAISKQIKYNNKLLYKLEKRNKSITKAENYRNKSVKGRNDNWLSRFQGLAEDAIKNNDNYIKIIDQKIKQR